MSDDPNLTARRDDPLPYTPVVLPVGGRYVLGDEIARGGMGVVLRATDTTLGREVAVKVLQEQFGPDSGTARRFADEAHIAGQLQHPGIPPVHDFGTLPDGRPFLAMKLIKGDTLDALLRGRRDPGDDRGRFVAVFEAMCQAVGYAHAHDVVHRDLKPANVMVGAFGEVQVMDWGLAKVLRPGGAADGAVADADATTPITEVRSLRDSDGDHTQAGSVMGTPAYMPPEQAAGAAHNVTPRSDVFGLGAVLAVILTGRPPFEAGSAETTRVKAAQGDVADCLARLDDCGAEPELVALCKRCLSPRPADRPADAGEVAAAVADFRAQSEARARQAELDRVKAEGEKATAEATAAEQRKRRRVQLVLAGAVVLMVAGAGSVAVWRVDEEGKKRTEAARLEGEERERVTKAAAEAERREQAERDRKQRAADAVAALLDLTRAALEVGDADRATAFLDQADRRASDDAVAAHTGRAKAYRDDLAVLAELDAVDVFRWTTEDGKVPSASRVAGRWAAAFARYGLVPGTTPDAEAAARINGSPVRTSLLAAAGGWLSLDPADAIRAVLDLADPDPFRAEVRRLLVARDGSGLTAVAARPEWTSQPGWFVRAFGTVRSLPVAVRQDFMAKAVIDRPADFGLLTQLGQSYPARSGATAAARGRWFQAALAVRPRSAIAHINLGSALFALGDMAGARACARAAVALDAKHAVARNNLGNALREAGDFAGSEAAFREAIGINPTFAIAYNGLGNVLRDKKDLAGAVAAYREAARLDPLYAQPWNNLSVALRELGDFAGGRAAILEAIRLDPDDAVFHYNLGVAYHDKRELDEAAAAYREAVRLDPTNATPQYNLGQALRMKRDFAGAEVAFREAIRIKPGDFEYHNALGFALEFQYQLVDAEAAYRESIRLNPKYAVAHSNLGDVCLTRGRVAEALACYRTALALQPDHRFAREGLDYCLRHQRGEVPTAPAPRAVGR